MNVWYRAQLFAYASLVPEFAGSLTLLLNSYLESSPKFSGILHPVCCSNSSIPRGKSDFPTEQNPKDWVCEKCDCSNFARRNECFRCSAKKPEWEVACSIMNIKRLMSRQNLHQASNNPWMSIVSPDFVASKTKPLLKTKRRHLSSQKSRISESLRIWKIGTLRHSCSPFGCPLGTTKIGARCHVFGQEGQPPELIARLGGIDVPKTIRFGSWNTKAQSCATTATKRGHPELKVFTPFFWGKNGRSKQNPWSGNGWCSWHLTQVDRRFVTVWRKAGVKEGWICWEVLQSEEVLGERNGSLNILKMFGWYIPICTVYIVIRTY